MTAITPADVERFTCGDCHYLARALHELTGWPIAAFSHNGYLELHAFVIMPDGRLLDVQGPKTARALRRAWQSAPGLRIARTTFPDLLRK